MRIVPFNRVSSPIYAELTIWLAFADLFYDRGNHYEFLSMSSDLSSAGELKGAQTFDFEFKNVEKQYESYNGINVKLR